MIPNVSQITSRLATMSDQQLQQYAQMHQEDPYIMALSVAEKNRRSALRTSAQGMQGEEPTVAEQELQEMAPAPEMPMEEAPADGIAGLEAQNLETVGMAAGGLVGYAEGGTAESFSSYRERMLEEDAVRRAEEARMAELARLERERASEAERLRRVAAMEAERGGPIIPVSPFLQAPPEATVDNRALLNQADAGLRAQPALQGPPAPVRDGIAALAPNAAPAAAAPTASAPANTPPGGVMDVVRADAPSAAPTGGGLAEIAAGDANAAPAQDGLGGLRTMMEDSRKRESDLIAKQAEATKTYYDQIAASATKEIEELKESTKDQDKRFDEKRGRIESREAELDKQKRQARSFAIIRAGLAMMSGESPYALVNIGKGLQAGLSQYQADLGEVDKAREGLRTELDNIADLQAQARAATGEKATALRKQMEEGMRQGQLKMAELLTSSGIEAARSERSALFQGLVSATFKEREMELKFARDKELAGYDRQTRYGVASISAAGRDGGRDKTDEATSKALKEAMDAAQKDIRWATAKDSAERQKIIDDYMELWRKNDPRVGEGAFVRAPTQGARVVRSPSLQQ